MGSSNRENFVNMEPRRAQVQAQSLSIRASPICSDHRSQSHLVLSRPTLRDQEMYKLRVQVRQLRQQLRQRVHLREHRSPMHSSNSNSGDERSHKKKTRSLPGNVREEPSLSVRGEKCPLRRYRTPPLRNMGGRCQE